ncbi:MAG: hypothetical protein KBA66_01980 [Leptospiraceae bacterium]|nr:hypothetical protein [Leptospiraceae bacterium]
MNSILQQIKIKFYQYISYRYWEFWPATIFYIPIVLYYILFLIKYRISPTAISAVNPCFTFGGMAFDSKFDMISKFFHFPDYVTKTVLIPDNKNRNLDSIRILLQENNIHYPFICKPDKGHRGNGFKIIRNQVDLLSYTQVCTRAFLIQEYIDYPLEYGIFWIKIPTEKKGRITSITRKILPNLLGNGKSNLAELILSDSRAKYMANTYFEKNKRNLEKIIPLGEKYRICNTGNHCQGAIFEDGLEDIQDKTLQVLEEICDSVKGYDFGRMDVKFKDKDALVNGKYFKILEVNGSEAESTHIYDRKYTFFYAYKTLYQQWNTLFKIAKLNRKNGFYGLTAKRFFSEYIGFINENQVIKSD